MTGLLLALAILAGGAIAAGLLSRPSVWAVWLAALVGLPGCLQALLAGTAESVRQPWSIPMGSLALRLDPLSAFFLVPTLIVAALAALYGQGHLRPRSWMWFHLLVAALVLVLLSADGVLFLMAWEGMSIASFALVMHDDAKPTVRRAGLVYLAATHLGSFFLLLLFLQANFPQPASLPATLGLFLLALAGFGLKAGFVPLHVWLPEAHPAAPTHVSALLSGVLLKTGIYGLLRVLSWVERPPDSWGWILLAVGIASGVMGVLLALAQTDLKRLLAYSSVENLGIIALGLGVWLLGSPLALAGALLHVWNHAWFKSLLFLAAGAVGKGTGSVAVEGQGGLLKRMPVTGWSFLAGSAAICGLPPLNGFVSEFLIFLGCFQLIADGHPVGGALALAALGLISGLAVACFSRAFGVVFLGEPRSSAAHDAHEATRAMRAAMLALSALCTLSVVAAPPALRFLVPAELPVMPAVALSACAFALGLAVWAWLRRLSAQTEGTWDCGYLGGTPRMQYTATSFAEPLLALFRLPSETREAAPQGYFPSQASWRQITPDLFERQGFAPLLRALTWLSARARILQHGQVQLYLLYILLTLLLLLFLEAR